jgi:hypothetical protein
LRRFSPFQFRNNLVPLLGKTPRRFTLPILTAMGGTSILQKKNARHCFSLLLPTCRLPPPVARTLRTFRLGRFPTLPCCLELLCFGPFPAMLLQSCVCCSTVCVAPGNVKGCSEGRLCFFFRRLLFAACHDLVRPCSRWSWEEINWIFLPGWVGGWGVWCWAGEGGGGLGRCCVAGGVLEVKLGFVVVLPTLAGCCFRKISFSC